MTRTHARPSKDFVCGRCKRRIRWMAHVRLGGLKGQLIWCERCWRDTRARPPGNTPPGVPGPGGPTPPRRPASMEGQSS